MMEAEVGSIPFTYHLLYLRNHSRQFPNPLEAKGHYRLCPAVMPFWLSMDHICIETYLQLGAKRVLTLFKDVLLRTIWALLLYTLYNGNGALLVLNGTSLNSAKALLALN